MKRSFLFIFVLLFSACSHEKSVESTESIKKVVEAPKAETPVAPAEPENLDFKMQEDLKEIWKNYFVEEFSDSRAVNVLVFTNRQNKMKGKGFGCTDEYYGVSTDTTTPHLGVCRVNVPRNHSTGELNIAKDQRESSHDFFKILGQKEFNLNTMIEYLKKSKRSPLLFVHGFNVKHEQAVLRAAQIAYDLKYQGPVLLFSWPAGAGDGFLDDKFIKRTYDSN